MTGLSAREAGDRVGLSKQAMLKAIKNGRLSAEKDAAGEWRIEPAELFRVYPAAATADDDRLPTDDAAGLRRENELLREMVADLREDRDRWREQATRLLPAPQPAARRGWWRRLRGE